MCLSILATYATADNIHLNQRSFVRGKRGLELTTKAAKVAKSLESLTFTARSWKEMALGEGDEMVWACTHRPMCEVFLERTFVSGETKVIEMCPPPITACNGYVFDNGVTMEKDESESYYILSGDALTNDEGEACDIHTDCAAGLFCDRSVCQKLTPGFCLPEREDRDCLVLDDPLKTKCHLTNAPLGGFCGCDNDPLNNPCEDPSHTCDFPCETGDAIPSCASPESRNNFCVEFTCVETSTCPAGSSGSPSCTALNSC
jgi:hypothetical protein